MEEICINVFAVIMGFGLGVIACSISNRARDKEYEENYRQWWYDNKKLIEEYQERHKNGEPNTEPKND